MYIYIYNAGLALPLQGQGLTREVRRKVGLGQALKKNRVYHRALRDPAPPNQMRKR